MTETDETTWGEPIGRWCQEASQCSPARFAARNSGLFFLVYPPDLSQAKVEFETVGISMRFAQLKAAVQAQQSASRVIKVKKSPRSPYHDRISIGRARNCDIVIRHPSVSKLHAHIHMHEDGSYTITDVGSHNGTRLDDRILVPRVPEPLSTNVVVLGTVTLYSVDALGLHAALMRISAYMT